MNVERLSFDEIKALRMIWLNRDITRLELLELLQVSHLTASNVIKHLETKDLIFKSGKKQGESGRPSTTYRIESGSGTTLGVHFDFNTLRFVLADTEGEMLKTWQSGFPEHNLPHQDHQIYINSLANGIEQAIEALKEEGYAVPFSIGISLPGMVDSESGIWVSGLQLQGIKNIPLQEELERLLSIPVFIEDSSRSLVLLEKVRGLAKEHRNIVLLYLGSGMGASIVMEDRILRGVHGTAGEIGHIPHGKSTYRCSCGNIGCFETIVSPYGIKRIFEDRLNEGVSSTLQNFKQGSSYTFHLEDIQQAARLGDHLSMKTLAEIGEYIGDAADILIKLFNPEILIITGSGAIFADFMRTSVETTINMKIPPEINNASTVVFAEYKPYYEAWGASMVALNELFKKELRRRK